MRPLDMYNGPSQVYYAKSEESIITLNSYETMHIKMSSAKVVC